MRTHGLLQESVCPGEAGSHFSLIKAMGLEGNRELYRTVKRVVRDSAIRSNIDFAQDYRNLPPERVAVIFRAVRSGSPYMDPKRFPNDWATAEILKQYLKNYRRHAVKKGRMPRRKDRLARSSSSAAGSSSPPRVPHARRGSVDGERLQEVFYDFIYDVYDPVTIL
ncbi:hypothetical protein CPC08DRAFT_821352 [Agrocybe pediades]|nr:hypothetical protein CPC08DRAFT_821352 [Agrocybe pediades]